MAFTTGPLSTRMRLTQGVGAVAFGVKDNGFSFFLLIFYNQVLGMDAGLVGLALALALVVDAIFDPLIGYFSDRTYTKWGRRLPWLYIAPWPLAIMWILLWSPPGGEAPSFFGLLGIAVGVRLLLSACEVPQVSLLPEITADYDERTTLFRYRYLMGWGGGILMMVLAYMVFLSGPDGMLEADGYFAFGITGALIMAFSVVGSALGLHKLVAHPPAQRPPPFRWRDAFAEIRDAFSEKAFLIFAAGALAAYISQGTTFSISNYLNVFVWQLDQVTFPGAPELLTGLTAYPVVLFLSALLMFVVVSPLHRRFGKPYTAAGGALAAFVLGFIPYFLFLLGAWPQAGTLASTGLFYLFLVFANASGIVSMISASSMVAEIIELFEERTGERAEGKFYAGNWLVQKCATGAGIFISGQIIALAQMPSDARPGEVGMDVLSPMILLYAGVSLILALIAAFWLARFPITRESHEARLAVLNDAARTDPEAESLRP
ncbi:MFS transporter [Alteriqipengyuania sp.]|uniref:MFS transporter n=1 Tax=Alteriqipengyuania sp. TaxID=2800692 RepID=UPI0035175A7E